MCCFEDKDVGCQENEDGGMKKEDASRQLDYDTRAWVIIVHTPVRVLWKFLKTVWNIVGEEE